MSNPSVNTVSVGPVRIGGPDPVFILGPCVIESHAHALMMGRALARLRDELRVSVIFKASFDKANRTSGKGFRGHGLQAGLDTLRAVREETGLPVTTDVHETAQVPAVAAAVDLIQVPALLCRQTDLLLACAESGTAVSVKKGQFLAPWDMKPLVEKFRNAGADKRLVLIERGTSFGYNALVNDFRGLPQMRALGVPVIFDATHSVQQPGGQGDASGGQGRFAPVLMRAAIAVGCEGFFVETHDHPERALSDGPNMIALDQLAQALGDVLTIHRALGRPAPLA